MTTTLTILINLLSAVRNVIENHVGQRDVLAQWLLQRVANDDFLGYENYHYNILYRTLPIGMFSEEDLRADIRRFAVEAAYRYDPSYRASFETFLWKHIQTRCLQTKQTAWRPKYYPQDGKGVRNETDWATRTDHNEGEAGGFSLDGFGGSGLRSTKSPDHEIDTKDILNLMGTEAHHIFNRIASDHDLIDMVAKPNQHKKLSERLGISRQSLDRMMEEVKHVGEAP